MQTLEQIYNQENTKLGIKENSSSAEKMIKSPITGKKVFVPGYIDDFAFQNDLKKKELDLDKITDANWNWNRQNKVIRKRDRIHVATAEFEPVIKTIPER